jgi:ATP-dependent DNA helicase RecG
MDDLKNILDRIRKPFAFASRDNFAHLNTLAAIETYMRLQIADLKRVSDDNMLIEILENLFTDFDILQPEEKRDRIQKAMALVDAHECGQHAPQSGSVRQTQEPTNLKAVKVRSISLPSKGEDQGNEETGRLQLDTPIQYCKGIGPKRAEVLKKIGISTIEDALSYFPWRYEDRGNLRKISSLSYGSYETVAGEVVSAEVVQTKRKRVRIFELLITDKTGMLVGSWFNQPFMQKMFKSGQKVILSGVVKANPYKGGLPQIDNPDYEIMDDDEADNLMHTGRIVPIYRTTAGLSVRYLRSMIRNVLDSCGGTMHEMLPDVVVEKYSLMPVPEAYYEAHFPTREKNMDVLNRGTSEAHRRLSFEELFVLELGLALRKRGVTALKKGIQFKPLNNFEAALRQNLHFKLTGAQERVIAEIRGDMTADQPMNRLVQGDVGSGKTIVAFIAALLAVENGYQACVMAPTEILAEQHYHNMTVLASPLDITVRSLTGGRKKKEKETVLAEIESGEAWIVVGTHALIEEQVKFKKLGLAIIDEQHRFGVMQRSTLTAKGYEPDVLVMTATPIPRTLALTVYGDLDVSVIDEMPKGRSPIITRLYFESRRREAYQFMERELEKGRQVYVVYPLVQETEKSDLKAATEMAVHLQKDVFPGWKIGLIHGRMKAEEKETVMAAFKTGVIHIMVSTTVIEVGVDIPNATVMVIEHPERFGLAQLHQLRGRVGRGAHQSFCILMGPRMFAEEARERLNAFVRTNDGFKIAEEDLRMRGPGEFFGTRQSGLPDLRAANIIRDADLLEKARNEAFQLLQQDPLLTRYPELRKLLKRKWQGRLGLISVG